MIAIGLGLLVGAVIAHGWPYVILWSLAGGLMTGGWRVSGAFRRLKSGQDYPTAFRDAINIAMGCHKSSDPKYAAATRDAPEGLHDEAYASYLVETRDLPAPSVRIYWLAMRYETYTTAGVAALTYWVKTSLF